MNDIRPFEEYKEMIKDMRKEEMIRGLYDLSARVTKQDKEIERLKQQHEAIKKYVHNHTITYIDNGIKCCKPDEYFNISWVEDMLNGNFENLDVLFEDSDK